MSQLIEDIRKLKINQYDITDRVYNMTIDYVINFIEANYDTHALQRYLSYEDEFTQYEKDGLLNIVEMPEITEDMKETINNFKKYIQCNQI